MSLDNNIDQSESYVNDEINLLEIFNIIWGSRIKLLIATIVAGIISILYSLSLTNYYKSDASFIVVDDSQQALPISSGLSSLAAFGGISLSPGGENKAGLILATIQSRAFLKHLITIDAQLPLKMSSTSFNKEDGTLILDEKKSKNQTFYEIHRTYKTILSVSQDGKTGFINISAEHVSPNFTKEFLELIVDQVNEILRRKDLEESSSALNYLTSEMAKTAVLDVKSSISELIESQLEVQMIAKIREDYALKAIEPPYIPEIKSKPVRSTMVITGTIFGAILFILWILINHYFYKQED